MTDDDIIANFERSAKLRGEAWPPPSGQPIEATRATPAIATVYFVGPNEGPIKIGYASRLEYRLRGLQLANAYPLTVWASVQAPPVLERQYHRRFAAHRLHGEWFARHPDILAEIARINSGAAS